MSDPLPLKEPEEEIAERDRRMEYRCPHCSNLIGECVIWRGRLNLVIGGIKDGVPYGIMQDKVSRGRCLACGEAIHFSQQQGPIAVQKFLRRRGYNPGEIRSIITGANGG